jgi:hypothetical protein
MVPRPQVRINVFVPLPQREVKQRLEAIRSGHQLSATLQPTHFVGDGKLLDCQAVTAPTTTLAVNGIAPRALTTAACALLTSG